MSFILKAEFLSVNARGWTFIFPGSEVTFPEADEENTGVHMEECSC